MLPRVNIDAVAIEHIDQILKLCLRGREHSKTICTQYVVHHSLGFEQKVRVYDWSTGVCVSDWMGGGDLK